MFSAPNRGCGSNGSPLSVRAALTAILLTTATGACSTPPNATAPPPGPKTCAVDETTLDDGTCQPPGVPPSMCGAGFQSDGNGGCDAILPAEDCPPGTMAVPGDTACKAVGAREPPACTAGQVALPGETACHELADCGAAPWGNIPLDSSTQFVDASYAGGGSDGSAQRPWTRIAQAVSPAAAGATIAVAEGQYVETLVLDARPVKIWGRCPSKVEIRATGGAPTVTIHSAAAQSELHHIAITGDSTAVQVSPSADGVVIDGAWIHDTGYIAVDAKGTLTVHASLVEAATAAGILVQYVHATVDGSVVRGSLPGAGGQYGFGLDVENGASVDVGSSLVERCHAAGVLALAADVAIEGSVIRDMNEEQASGARGAGIAFQSDGAKRTLTVRDTLLARDVETGIIAGGTVTVLLERTAVSGTRAPAADATLGVGLAAQFEPAPSSAKGPSVTVRSSLFERNHATGIVSRGGDVIIDASVVRDTLATADNTGVAGTGIGAQAQPKARGSVAVHGSLLERNHSIAIGVAGVEAIVDATLIRGTLPEPKTKEGGYGIEAVSDVATKSRGKLTLRSSVLSGNESVGILVIDTDAEIDASVVREMRAQAKDGALGRGVAIQSRTGTAGPTLSIQNSLVDGAADTGILVFQGSATIVGCAVRKTGPVADGTLGDGIAVDRGTASVSASRVEGSARAGLAAFGADVTLASSSFQCNAIDLDGENERDGTAYSFENQSTSACGCAPASQACQVLSSDLSPPAPVATHP